MGHGSGEKIFVVIVLFLVNSVKGQPPVTQGHGDAKGQQCAQVNSCEQQVAVHQKNLMGFIKRQ